MHHANNNPSHYYYHHHSDVISGRPEKSYHHPAEYYNPEKDLPTTRKRRAHDFEKDEKQVSLHSHLWSLWDTFILIIIQNRCFLNNY